MHIRGAAIAALVSPQPKELDCPTHSYCPTIINKKILAYDVELITHHDPWRSCSFYIHIEREWRESLRGGRAGEVRGGCRGHSAALVFFSLCNRIVGYLSLLLIEKRIVGYLSLLLLIKNFGL